MWAILLALAVALSFHRTSSSSDDALGSTAPSGFSAMTRDDITFHRVLEASAPSIQFTHANPHSEATAEPPFRCEPAALREKLAKTFKTLRYDGSNCPREDWFALMAQADAHRPKLFVNIGVNKGYNIAIWMNIFTPANHVDTHTWKKLLPCEGDDYKCCGACFECKQKTYTPPAGNAVPSQLTILAVDLNDHNLQQINTNFQKLAPDMADHGVSIYTLHAAVSDKSGTVTIPDCIYGDEICSLRNTSYGHSKYKQVSMLTVDEIMSAFFHAAGRSVHGYGDRNYHPLIDILLIDTEGHDPLALAGSKQLFKSKKVRCVIFEYHAVGHWESTQLQTVLQDLEAADFECYFQGQGRLWKITDGCWHANYEFHDWSNVMCIQKQDSWLKIVQPLVVKVLV